MRRWSSPPLLRRILVLTAMALVFGPATHAFAQGTATENTAERPTPPIAGREMLERAQDAFAAGEYQVALGHFRALNEQVPRASIVFNIALCLERLGRLQEAAATYNAVIATGELSEEGVARARENLAGLEEQMGEVSAAVPEGGELIIGDASCSIPCALNVDPGSHLVVIHGEGGVSSESLLVGPGSDVRALYGPPATLVPEAEAADPVEVVDDSFHPGPLFWVGGGLALAGGAGTIGFGLRTNRLHDEYSSNVLTAPAAQSTATADEGERMKLLTNISIATLGVGAALVLLDLLVN